MGEAATRLPAAVVAVPVTTVTRGEVGVRPAPDGADVAVGPHVMGADKLCLLTRPGEMPAPAALSEVTVRRPRRPLCTPTRPLGKADPGAMDPGVDA